MRRRIATTLVALSLTASALAPASGAASPTDDAPVARSGVEIPGAAADALAVDVINGRLYVPDEATGVVVLDLDGAEVRRVDTGEIHVRELSVTPDGSTLWAAAGGVAVGVDTDSWEVRSYPVGDPEQRCVGDLVALSTGVAVVDTCDHQVLLLDPVSGDLTTIAELQGGNLSVAGFGSRLFVKDAATSNTYPERVRAYEVSDGHSAAEVGSVEVSRGNGPVEVASDGSHVMLGDVVSADLDLTRLRRFFSGYGVYPTVGGRGIEDFSYGLRLHAAGTRGSLASVRWDASTVIFAMGTIGSTVYALGRVYSDPPRLFVWTPTVLNPLLEVELDRRSVTYRAGETALLTVTAPYGNPGVRVTVTFAERGREPRTIVTGELGEDRRFVAEIPVLRKGTVRAVYAGDASTRSDAAEIPLRVKQGLNLVPYGADSVHGRVARFSGGSLAYVIALNPTYRGNCARISISGVSTPYSYETRGCVRLPMDKVLLVRQSIIRQMFGRKLAFEVRVYNGQHGAEEFVKSQVAIVTR